MQMFMIAFRSSLKERVHELLYQCGVKAFTELNETVGDGKNGPGCLEPMTTLSVYMIVGQLGWICSHLASRPEQWLESLGRKQHEISSYRRIQVQGAMASRLL